MQKSFQNHTHKIQQCHHYIMDTCTCIRHSLQLGCHCALQQKPWQSKFLYVHTCIRMCDLHANYKIYLHHTRTIYGASSQSDTLGRTNWGPSSGVENLLCSGRKGIKQMSRSGTLIKLQWVQGSVPASQIQWLHCKNGGFNSSLSFYNTKGARLTPIQHLSFGNVLISTCLHTGNINSRMGCKSESMNTNVKWGMTTKG